MSNQNNFKTVIGLMSGTSMDGVDAAIIETDGESIKGFGGYLTFTYTKELKARLVTSIEQGAVIDDELENDITKAHAVAVKQLLSQEALQPQDIDLIGFHGQTIFHDPNNAITNQIGDGKLLAELTHIDVVNDFRSNDVANGGQGAPLIPLFHQALFKQHEKPIAVVNIGGVSNITFLGEHNEVIAYDTGSGNALIDDVVRTHNAGEYDKDGAFAAKGAINQEILADLIDNPFFERNIPKSLDRNAFAYIMNEVTNLSLEDSCATLAAFTATSIMLADKFFVKKPIMTYITGGGSRNKFIMDCLYKLLDGKVKTIEEAKSDDIKYISDAIEAQGFGFLAVRSIRKLPLSLPTTTGVKKPVSGGVLHKYKV